MERNSRWMKAILIALWSLAPQVDAQVLRGGGQGAGAAAMGMGGAYTSIAEDASAAYWNPAGLAQLRRIEILGMFGSLFNDKSRHSYLSVHYPTNDDIHIGFSYSNLYFTDLRGAHEDDWTVAFGIPVSKDRRWMVGGAFHYLYSDLKTAGGIGKGSGIDLGVLYLHPLPKNRQLRFALTFTDLFTTMRYNNGVEQSMPRAITPSVAFRYDENTLVGLDTNFYNMRTVSAEGKFRFRLGAERWFFNRRWALRAGYEKFTTVPGTFSLGAGYENKRWSLDYAYLGHQRNLGNSHRVSAAWSFDAPGVAQPEGIHPVDLQALVGEQKIHLRWKLPPKARVDGYWVYYRAEEEKEYHRRRPEFLETDYCVLRGAMNGVKYHIYLCLVTDGKQGPPSNEVTAIPRPILPAAKESYDIGVQYFNEGKYEEGLSAARKAEQQDPENIDVKELLRRLQKAKNEGLVKETL